MAVTREFKEFIMRGNVVDLAVGIVIGAAFGSIVNSFVNDVLMPPIGMALGHVDFAQLKWVLHSRHHHPRWQTRRRSRYPLRHLHQHPHQLPHHRLRRLPRRQGCQHPQNTRHRPAPRWCPRLQRMPVLPLHHPLKGPPLPPLHFRPSRHRLTLPPHQSRSEMEHRPRALASLAAPLTRMD